MSDSPTFVTRLGRMFKRSNSNGSMNGNGHATVSLAEPPPMPLVSRELPPAPPAPAETAEPRPSVLRPWRRQNEALTQMQQGFSTLTELMGTIQQNLETQNRRQEELIGHLSALPRVLEIIPESNRMQTEALRVLQSHLALQTDQHNRLSNVLDPMTTAMSAVSRNTQASAEVLEQMRANLGSRDQILRSVLEKQNSRTTTLLAISIILSIGSVLAVSIVGWLVMLK